MILLGLNNHKNTDLKDSSKCHGRPVTGHISLKSKALGPMPTGWRKSMKAHSSSLAGIIARLGHKQPPKNKFWMTTVMSLPPKRGIYIYIYIYAHTCKLYSYIIRWTCLKKHSRLISSLDPLPHYSLGSFPKPRGLSLFRVVYGVIFFHRIPEFFFETPMQSQQTCFLRRLLGCFGETLYNIFFGGGELWQKGKIAIHIYIDLLLYHYTFNFKHCQW